MGSRGVLTGLGRRGWCNLRTSCELTLFCWVAKKVCHFRSTFWARASTEVLKFRLVSRDCEGVWRHLFGFFRCPVVRVVVSVPAPSTLKMISHMLFQDLIMSVVFWDLLATYSADTRSQSTGSEKRSSHTVKMHRPEQFLHGCIWISVMLVDCNLPSIRRVS